MNETPHPPEFTETLQRITEGGYDALQRDMAEVAALSAKWAKLWKEFTDEAAALSNKWGSDALPLDDAAYDVAKFLENLTDAIRHEYRMEYGPR